MIKNFLIDMDGVLYEGMHLIPGALQAIEYLQRKDYNFLLFTNTNSKTKDSLMRKLSDLGFGILSDSVFTALDATMDYIVSKKPNAKIFPLQNKEIIKFMNDSGLKMAQNESEDIDFVVLGVDYSNTFQKMDSAFRVLYNTKAEFLLVSGDRFYPGDGKSVMGP
ncbi:MAG: hypothetical protein Q7K42_04135, partial [Candidatus Diapherotrites archaeon]|nr:hypothetical protein [Candidatus Diapherotrites archaeon]